MEKRSKALVRYTRFLHRRNARLGQQDPQRICWAMQISIFWCASWWLVFVNETHPYYSILFTTDVKRWSVVERWFFSWLDLHVFVRVDSRSAHECTSNHMLKECAILFFLLLIHRFDQEKWLARGGCCKQQVYFIRSPIQSDKVRNFLVLTLISSLIKILERVLSFHPVNGVKCNAHHWTSV